MNLKNIVLRIKNKGINGMFRAIVGKIKYKYYRPKIVLNNKHTTIKLGTDYGEKVFIDRPTLKNSTIISCGVGEDISFDIEFAKKYNATIIMLDPTPRAIDHYDKIIEQIENGNSGVDQVNKENDHLLEMYDLTGVNKDQLVLEKFALWTENTTLNFYLPVNKANVSHSLVNFQNDYKQGDEYEHIKVNALTLSDIINKYKINQIELLKLDIEGAEIEVIKKMLDDKIFPKQVCVEFDGLNVPSKRAKFDFERIDNMLRSNGYELIYYDGLADFTYVLNATDKKN
ncbi:FkbM family methyltransferase [Aquimarina algiphila]|uniref:FkbM family methyltransferase n=1 Tax=Aquimarina algiphila TaxID=2047982 RepID=UPI0024912948|nr:FkbM family methyltransferase [Aquimarina algiphila]